MMPMLIVAVLLQCFDQYSTITLLQHGGIEANSFVVWLFGLVGVERAIILLKTLGVGVVCFIAYICDDGRGVKILGLLNAYYLVLLGAFNFRYLWKVI